MSSSGSPSVARFGGLACSPSCSKSCWRGLLSSSALSGVLLSLVTVSLLLLWRDLERRRWRRHLGCFLEGSSSAVSSPLPSLGCPPCIYHMMRWRSSALWAVVPVRLLHHRPYRRCLRSQSRACRLNRRRWLLSGWWVGSEFLRHPHPSLAGHSSAKVLLTRRETLMNLAHHRKASAERYPRR